MSNEQDIALQALLEVYEKHESMIDLEIIKDCYLVEKSYQYEKDADLPLEEIRRIVTKAVDKQLAEE